MAVTKIISGGQAGADRAGLDAALILKLYVGGWVPRGRRTEGQPLSDVEMHRYKLREHLSPHYPPRTEQNIRESDGTVIFGNVHSPGCALTYRLCDRHHKPCLVMEAVDNNPAKLRKWLDQNRIAVLNVAGNRESTNPGIYALTRAVLLQAIE